MTDLFIIKGTRDDGLTFYYTGKAGDSAFSQHRNQAVSYTRGGPDSNAVRLVEAMNKGKAKSKITWAVAPAKES